MPATYTAAALNAIGQPSNQATQRPYDLLRRAKEYKLSACHASYGLQSTVPRDWNPDRMIGHAPIPAAWYTPFRVARIGIRWNTDGPYDACQL